MRKYGFDPRWGHCDMPHLHEKIDFTVEVFVNEYGISDKIIFYAKRSLQELDGK